MATERGSYQLYLATSKPAFRKDMELTFILVPLHPTPGIPRQKMEACVTCGTTPQSRPQSAWFHHEEAREGIVLGGMLLGTVSGRDRDELKDMITAQEHLDRATHVLLERGRSWLDREWVEIVLRRLIHTTLLHFEARPMPNVDQVVPVLCSFGLSVLNSPRSWNSTLWGGFPTVVCPVAESVATRVSTPHPYPALHSSEERS